MNVRLQSAVVYHTASSIQPTKTTTNIFFSCEKRKISLFSVRTPLIRIRTLSFNSVNFRVCKQAKPDSEVLDLRRYPQYFGLGRGKSLGAHRQSECASGVWTHSGEFEKFKPAGQCHFWSANDLYQIGIRLVSHFINSIISAISCSLRVNSNCASFVRLATANCPMVKFQVQTRWTSALARCQVRFHFLFTSPSNPLQLGLSTVFDCCKIASRLLQEISLIVPLFAIVLQSRTQFNQLTLQKSIAI